MQNTYTKKEVITDANGNTVDFILILSQKKNFDNNMAALHSILDPLVATVTKIYQTFPADVPPEIIEAFGLKQ